ncbi:PhzF family phenazine biosynthesis protein [Teredinibacter turnerae]|uniref:PhzF family phenazine biosynthesis protein n=1 Tax=Teredinibacter turnerae TaxID=2426 RepID=UPI001E390583|nr:PhzF family phenazine biosynthesis protein [Teredinibacter turnerae]
MSLKMGRVENLFIVKAFASQPFAGNPAAVCVLTELPSAQHMQQIAREMNQPITSFVVPELDGTYTLRHYGPTNPVDICGHGTIATSHVVYEYLGHSKPNIDFNLATMNVRVGVRDKGFELEIPAFPCKPVVDVPCVVKFLGVRPLQCYRSFYDVIAEFATEDIVRSLKPDFSVPLVNSIRALLVTAKGNSSDYVYRVFAPSIGVNEDYFCGSANGALGPLWRDKCAKNELLGYSVSERGGPIPCVVQGEKVRIYGQALTWFSGTVKFDACA